MERYFRVEKPVPHKPHSKPPLQKASTPTHAPAPREWADVISSQAASVDISALSDAEIEQIMRLFDLNPGYGPFVGVEREFRWRRAEKCGLNPPELVKRIIDSGRAVPQREGGQLW